MVYILSGLAGVFVAMMGFAWWVSPALGLLIGVLAFPVKLLRAGIRPLSAVWAVMRNRSNLDKNTTLLQIYLTLSGMACAVFGHILADWVAAPRLDLITSPFPPEAAVALGVLGYIIVQVSKRRFKT